MSKLRIFYERPQTSGECLTFYVVLYSACLEAVEMFSHLQHCMCASIGFPLSANQRAFSNMNMWLTPVKADTPSTELNKPKYWQQKNKHCEIRCHITTLNLEISSLNLEVAMTYINVIS